MLELRDYQVDLLKQVNQQFGEGHGAVMMQLATGGGKTGIAAAFARQFDGPVLFLCHTLSVIGQVPGEFSKWGLSAIPVGSGYQSWDKSLLASKATNGALACTAITASNRLILPTGRLSRKANAFAAIIVDEAHHAADPLNGSGTRVNQLVELAKEDSIPVLGLTATPWRMSKRQGFTETWDSLVTGPEWLTLRGKYLSDVTLRTAGKNGVTGAGAHSGQDYKEQATMTRNKRNPLFIEGAFEFLDRYAGDPLPKTLMYAVGQEHALRLAEVAVARNIPTGLLLSDNDKLKRAPTGVVIDRHEVREGLRNGDLRLVINVNMVTEGYDCPDVECVICLRPTMSLALWKQMCGRGSRLSEGKERLLMIDLTDNHDRLGDPLLPQEWSLSAREEDKEPGDPIMRYCVGADGAGCDSLIYTGHHVCPECQRSQVAECTRCGSQRFHSRLENGVCDSCHQAIQWMEQAARGDWGSWSGEPWYAVDTVRQRQTQYGTLYYLVVLADSMASAFKKHQPEAWGRLHRWYNANEQKPLQVRIEENGRWNNVAEVREV